MDSPSEGPANPMNSSPVPHDHSHPLRRETRAGEPLVQGSKYNMIYKLGHPPNSTIDGGKTKYQQKIHPAGVLDGESVIF